MTVGLVLFILSAILMCAFIAFKVFEMRRGVRFFDAPRKRLDRWSLRLYRTFVFGEIPRQYRASVSVFLTLVLHRGIRLLVHTLRAAERPLTRASHRLRTRVQQEGREPSEFLQTITPPPEGGKSKKNSV